MIRRIYFDQAKLQAALLHLQEEINRQPQVFSEERIRRERARLTTQALVIERDWYGPAPCEGCFYFHGSHGINCVPHPKGPTESYCSDWSGMEQAQDDRFYYEAERGWTIQRYVNGRGWVVVRDQRDNTVSV